MVYILVMKTEKLDIGKRIKAIRKKAGMNQHKLGSLLGVSLTTISDYETGTTYPSPASLAKIAKVGETTLDYLITGEEILKAPHHASGRPPASYQGQRIVLSDPEHTIIEAYRLGDDTDKLGFIHHALGIIKREKRDK